MFSLSSIKTRISSIILFFAVISLVNAYIHLSSVERSQTLFEQNKQKQLNAYTIAHDIQNQLQVLSAFKHPVNVDHTLLENALFTLQDKIILLTPYFKDTDKESLLNNFQNQSVVYSTQYRPFLDQLDSLQNTELEIKKQGSQLGYTAHDYQSIELMYIILCIKEELVLAQRSGRSTSDHKLLSNKISALNLMIESGTHYSPELLNLVKGFSSQLNTASDHYINTKNGLKNLTNTVNDFHDFLRKHHVRSLVEDIYLLRVYENELLSQHQLLYFDQNSVDQFKKNYANIFIKIEQSKISQDNKTYLSNILQEYINTLDQITDIATQVEGQKTILSQSHRQLFDYTADIFKFLPIVLSTENSKIANDIKQESFLIACIYLLIALCIFVVFWMAINNRILSPLKELQLAAKQYGEGEKNVTVDIHSKDELGQLAQTFNGMITQLNSNNAQLVDSLEAITLQDDNKRNFVAMISHEIRTPLNGIIGMAYLAQQSNTDLKVQSYLDSIFKSSDSLLGIINDLMDFSKIESSKFDLNPTESNITHLLDQVCSTVGLFAEGKKLPLFIDIDSKIPQIMNFDSLRLQQVLINLTNNSIKFTQSGQVQIKIIRLNNDDPKIAHLKFSIIDSGPGLSPEQQELIFTPFKQADSSITRKFGGTGLGLSISQELINLMDSKIKIKSTVGEGSEFYFTLKLPITDEPNIDKSGNYLLFSGTYLLFTDDYLIKQNIKKNLCKQDVLLHADKVGQTKEYISDTQFDFIILDWQSLCDSLEEKKLIVEALQKTAATVMVLSDIQHSTSVKNFCLPLINQYPNRLILSNKPFIRFNLINPQWDTGTIQSNDFYDESLYIKGKVLVVEDDLINQQVMMELLKSFGLDVYVADNGREAINMANKIFPDVILMDIEMPGMDGYQSCHELRSQNQFGNTPIIALTGHDILNTPKYKQAKFDDALVKPIDPTALHRLLQSHLMQQLNEQKLVQLSKMDDLALLTTFDYDSGLKRVAGEKRLYINLLTEFHSHYSDAKLVLDMLIQANDFDPAAKYCHKLKGVAANLGSTKLQNSLNELEEKLKIGENCDSALQAFEQCFTESISEISLFLQTLPKTNENKVSHSIKSKDEIFNGLYRYIDNADGEIIDYFHEHKNVFKKMLDQRDFDQLDDAINRFNFAKAASILNSEA
ncbi:MAG: response regulator [Saccharospirillaceae bacterium]|nr:ATP-binding protein [Pseudomonadales bacterium]NRB80782.1 response regulator [Saccharospirillaceae bacterium]